MKVHGCVVPTIFLITDNLIIFHQKRDEGRKLAENVFFVCFKFETRENLGGGVVWG